MPYSIYIDSPLLNSEEYLHDSFEAIEKLLRHGDFRFYFSKEVKTNNLLSDLRSILEKENSLEEKEIESFLNDYRESSISFSWGVKQKEFVFIIITDAEEYLLEMPIALIGLMLHETMHGVERLRGLEDDLNRNMRFSQEFFTNFIKLLPKTYLKEDLEQTLVSIAQTSVFVLKEWYANRELIERDYTSELLYYYETMFGLNESIESEKLPILEITLPDNPELGSVDLKNFTDGLNFFLSLTPAYIPFLRMHTNTYGYQTAERIRKFLSTRYPNLQSVANELHYLEDLYLTEFSYTKNFQQKFYTQLFSLVYRYLGGQTFLIWHYVDIVNNIENLPDFNGVNKDSSLNEIVLTPILKAASIFCKENKIPDELEKGLQEKLQVYLSKEEIEEWDSSWSEFDMEKLLLLPLQHLVEKLREKFLNSIQELRKYTRIILKILHLLKSEDLLKSCQEWRNNILKFISERDSRFSGLQILLPLEFSIRSLVFKDPYELTSHEVKEALLLFRYYAIPKTNYHITVLIKIARLIKFGTSKIDFEKPEEASQALAMTVSMFLASDDEFTDLRYIHIIFKLLLEVLDVPLSLAKKTAKIFGGLLQSQEI